MSSPRYTIDDYIEKSIVTISIFFGLNDALDISNKVHFLKYLSIFIMIIIITFYLQNYIEKKKNQCNDLFVLFWKISSKIVSFIQQFITAVVFNIIVNKIRKTDSGLTSLDIYSKIMVYIVLFSLLTTPAILFEWYFYESKEHMNIDPKLKEEIISKKIN